MLRLFFHKNFRIFFFLFFVAVITVTAQETNIYNQLLKESLKPDFMMMDIPFEVDLGISNEQIFKDIYEENVYRMLYRHRIAFLLPKEYPALFKDTMPKLSRYATSFFYTNAKNESWDNGKFNGDGSFSGEFAMKHTVLESKASRVMVSVPSLLFLLVTVADKAGIISMDDINAPKESKKAKALRTIKKDVYHIED